MGIRGKTIWLIFLPLLTITGIMVNTYPANPQAGQAAARPAAWHAGSSGDVEKSSFTRTGLIQETRKVYGSFYEAFEDNDYGSYPSKAEYSPRTSTNPQYNGGYMDPVSGAQLLGPKLEGSLNEDFLVLVHEQAGVFWIKPVKVRRNMRSSYQVWHGPFKLDPGLMVPKLLKEIKKEYRTLNEAVEGEDYRAYPVKEGYLPHSLGIKTDLDTSAGGGYKCCGQPTSSVYIDRKTGVFWVNYYQAKAPRPDGSHINSAWYGPFKLDPNAKDPAANITYNELLKEIRKEYGSFAEAGEDSNYRNYPAKKECSPKIQNSPGNSGQYLNPANRNKLKREALPDASRLEYKKGPPVLYVDKKTGLFWIQQAVWYGPFRLKR